MEISWLSPQLTQFGINSVSEEWKSTDSSATYNRLERKILGTVSIPLPGMSTILKI
jgi:hypothetical protein